MKCHSLILVLALIAVTQSFAQQRSTTSFGLELGYGTRTHNTSGYLVRGFYGAEFGTIEMEVGALMTSIADDGFGFDIKTRIPIESQRKKTSLLASFGFQTLVWSNTVSIGIPIGVHYRIAASESIVLEPSMNIAPSFVLTPDDKNFVLFDVRLGIRF
jgi:hypothetical protein